MFAGLTWAVAADVGAVLSPCVAATGLGLLIWQVRHLRLLREGDARGRLYAQSAEVRLLIARHPHIRAYFFDGRTPVKGSDDHDLVLTVAELYANYLEHLFLLSSHLQADGEDWKRIVRDVVASSPAIRQQLEAHPIWYCDPFLAHLGIGRVDRRGSVVPSETTAM